MKGTIDASVENAAEVLRNDIKEKAEHYTVVDLLGMISVWLLMM